MSTTRSPHVNHEESACQPRGVGRVAICGFVLLRTGQETPIDIGSSAVGSGADMSRLLAEFTGLARGLESFRQHHGTSYTTLNVYGQSRLVIEIMTKKIRANSSQKYYTGYFAAVQALRKIRSHKIVVSFHLLPKDNKIKGIKL